MSLKFELVPAGGWAKTGDESLPPRTPPPPPQCTCGRFISKKTLWQHGPDVTGMSTWGWHCSRCGDVVERS